jgi:hypothetical protein
MIFGPKTGAWLDVWSLEHFVSGMAISSFCVLLADKVFLKGVKEIPVVAETRVYIITILLVEYMWEVMEFYMEAGYTHVTAITYWFQGVEHWGNRLLADPLITWSGGIVGLHRPRLVLPARVFSLTFLLVHLFVFPHCMYLQDLIEKMIR